MNKNDKRSIKTQMLLKNVFYDLIRENDIDRITVTQICDRALVNRRTFYNYFLDYPDFKEHMLQEACDLIYESTIEQWKEGDSTESLMGLFRAIETHPDEAYLILSTEVANEPVAMFYKKLSASTIPIICKRRNISEEEAEIVLRYEMSGVYMAVRYWSHNRDSISRSTLIEMLTDLHFNGVAKYTEF